MAAANSTLFTMTSDVPLSSATSGAYRGVFHKHQSALLVSISGNTVTARMEQETSFAIQDTFSVSIAIEYA